MKQFLSTFILALLCAQLAMGTNFYVDNGCANNGNGTTTTCGAGGGNGPFNSIANVQSAVTGDQHGNSVLLKAGETFREQYTVPANGTAAGQFTIGSYGSGNAPIISGANILTGWTLYSPVTYNWTSIDASFNYNDASYTYAITGGGCSGSGTVTQANMRLSLIAGTAFADFSASSVLTGQLGCTLTITDGSSKTIVGTIQAAGSGETYGSQLLNNSTFADTSGLIDNNTTSLSITAGCNSAHCLQVTLTLNFGRVTQNVSLTSGMLIQNSAYLKKGTETGWLYMGMQNPSAGWLTSNPYNILPSVWTKYVEYCTASLTNPYFTQSYQGDTSGQTELFDTPSAVQVLAPSSTGVTIGTSSGGNTYYISYSTAPNQVFEDGNLLTQNKTSAASLTAGQWYLDTGNSRIWVYLTGGDAPSNGHTMEANQRSSNVALNSASYVTVQGLNLTKAILDNVYAGGNSDNLRLVNNTVSYSGGDAGNGCVLLLGSSHSLIQGNAISNCASHGIYLSGYNGAVTTFDLVQFNDVSYTSQIYDDTSGIYAWEVGQASEDVFQYNRVHNSGSPTLNGHGIQTDTNSQLLVLGNVVFLNYGGCLSHDANSPSFFYQNTCYKNNEGVSDLGELWDFNDGVGSGGAVWKNNIAVASTGRSLIVEEVGTSNTYDYNSYSGGSATAFCFDCTVPPPAPNNYNFTDWKSHSSQDVNSTTTAPTFANAGASQFWQTVGSSGIASGTSLGAPYNVGIEPGSSWPYNVFTVTNTNNDLGVFPYTGSVIDSVTGSGTQASGTTR